ncbi:MAG: hypothetical protein Q4B78_02860 [Bacillota bacterium]|nr:hypothetical protein [Bacillota bacterium]
MSIFYNEKLNTAIKLLCMAMAVGLLIIAKVVYEADMLSLAIYVGFAIFYVQLPGLFLLRLFRLNFNRLCTRLCAGFFTGWAAVVLQYFICEGIHSNLILYALGPIGSIAYIVMPVLRRAKARDGQATAELKGSCCPAKGLKNLSTAFCIFTLLVFAYAMLSTQLQYINPAYCATTYMNPDKAYHMGLIDSLSHGWPLESPWVKGRVIKYHIFTELLMAVPVRLFAVPSDVAIFSFNPLMTTYVLCISTYTMFREFTRKSNRAGLYCLSIILANMFLVRTPHTSMAFHFVIINDNAVGYGVSCFMFALVLFKLWYDKVVENSAKARSNMGYLLLLVAMVMLMTGIKGPIGIVFVGAIWGTG